MQLFPSILTININKNLVIKTFSYRAIFPFCHTFYLISVKSSAIEKVSFFFVETIDINGTCQLIGRFPVCTIGAISFKLIPVASRSGSFSYKIIFCKLLNEKSHHHSISLTDNITIAHRKIESFQSRLIVKSVQSDVGIASRNQKGKWFLLTTKVHSLAISSCN